MKTLEETKDAIWEEMDANDWSIPRERMMELACWQEHFQRHIDTITEYYIEAMGHRRCNISSMDWCNGNIDLGIEIYHCSCCGPDYARESMPVEYLWDEDWKQEMDKLSEERKETVAKKRKAELQKYKDDEKAKELKQLAALQAKYKETT